MTDYLKQSVSNGVMTLTPVPENMMFMPRDECEAMKGVRERALEQAATDCDRYAYMMQNTLKGGGYTESYRAYFTAKEEAGQFLAKIIRARMQPPAQELVGQGLGEGGKE